MPTVMVVDDTALIRETVAKILRREGFEAVCSANGKEAIDALDNALIDLVLLDVMMPVMDGMQCLQEIRNNPRLHCLPVIMMTAVFDDASEFRAIQLGAQGYLVKARFTIDQMLDSVRRHLAV